MNTENLGLVPLLNFGEILPNIYRSAQPHYQYQYDWLKDTLKLDYIVNFRAEAPLADRLGVDCSVEPVTSFVQYDHQPPTNEQALEYMRWVKAHENSRILIHCEHGQGRTSTFSVLTKLAMGWSYPEAIRDEETRFHYGFRHHAQKEWLDTFVSSQFIEIEEIQSGDKKYLDMVG